MQIAEIAKSVNIPLVASDKIDTVFDGADQIDSHGYLIKGGGGALLRENILAISARKIVIMADHTKFSKYLNKNVPVEVHPFAKYAADTMIKKMGGKPTVRTLDRGYPFITENGNLVLDCDFGTIKTPASLARKISTIAGVISISAICIDVGTPYTVMLFFLQCLPKARTNAVAALPLPRPSI